jgi:hypothetical protein
MVSSP